MCMPLRLNSLIVKTKKKQEYIIINNLEGDKSRFVQPIRSFRGREREINMARHGEGKDRLLALIGSKFVSIRLAMSTRDRYSGA